MAVVSLSLRTKVALAMAIVTGVVFGVVPAFHATRAEEQILSLQELGEQ